MTDPREQDPRLCSACGQPLNEDGRCPSVQRMLDGIKTLGST